MIEYFFRKYSATVSLLVLASCAQTPQAPPPPERPPLAISKLAIVTADKTHHLGADAGCLTDVEDSFSQELLAKGFHLADRSDVAAAMKEIGFQSSGLSDSDGVKIGKMLNVPAVLILSVTESSSHKEPNWMVVNGVADHWVGTARLSVRLVNVQTDELMLSQNESTKQDIGGPQEATSLLAPLATKLALEMPRPRE